MATPSHGDLQLNITRIVSSSKAPLAVVWLGLLYFTATTVIAVLINTPVNAALGIVWRWLALPLAGLVFGYTALRWRAVPVEKRRWFAWPLALAIYLLVVITSQSFVIATNSIEAKPQEVVLAGPVLRKWTRSYKTTSHYLQIVDDRSQAKLTLLVSSAEYASLAVGATYRRTYWLGRFGIPYRWTLDWS